MAVFKNSSPIVTDGLVLYLDAGNVKSYPTTGTTWVDLVGVNNGTLTNGPTFNSGNGGSIMFDGVDDSIDFSNVYEIGTSDFSFEVWVKSTYSGGWQYIFTNKENFNGPFVKFGFENGSGKLRLYLEADTQANSILATPLSYTDGEWHHAVFSRVNGDAFIYVDGDLKNSFSTQTGNVGNSTSNWIIGHNGVNTEFFNGSLSNFKFYSTPLTIEEIQQNYNATKQRFNLT